MIDYIFIQPDRFLILGNGPMQAPSAKELDGADKLALQGYGRPYKDGKPGGKCGNLGVMENVCMVLHQQTLQVHAISMGLQVESTTPILVRQKRCH